ncbi:hypothetical protein PUNSTDRAFT_94812 [Punctularia strigosozonata HHB-11173 SS5]|uniref:uncharacterized protein n=1 Tax=Punctularia strigosozonata (strain HHB-11173) TaxID=741275 RepID=UPI000441751A|nr:uncharacterized protein PUNSTDRAFT_94812 [Punctularia strigosozonata HHB-11173 SS5]EIN13625.1 hypothetical protein PUNSTDRAFT_94812 [Punctularia strigosozonata HHB-11173 SS5]
MFESALPIQHAPSNDENAWYYPSRGHDSDEESLPAGLPGGNWGRKAMKGSRWTRRGKIAAWGPGIDEWEAEERARKRVKLLLPEEDRDRDRSPSPPRLPHLRSPSPPLTGPYPDPHSEHLSYTSLVMDKSAARTFRSHMIDDLERAASGFIQAEGVMKRALGRLWQVMSEDPDLRHHITTEQQGTRTMGANGIPKSLPDEHMEDDSLVEPKQEQEDEDMTAGSDVDEEERERRRRLARAPDLTPSTHKIFITEHPPAYSAGTARSSQPHINGVNGHVESVPEPPDRGRDRDGQERAFVPVEAQLESLEKSLAALHELADDGREYVERLEEIRNGLGEMKAQRAIVWDVIRSKAVKELESAALAAVA